MSSERRQRGVTLIELIIFIVIMGIAVTGLLRVLSVSAIGSADPVLRKQALMIAESLMEEVQHAGFTLCDPSSANAAVALTAAACEFPEAFGQEGSGAPWSRPFDNINDYVTASGVPASPFTAGGKIVDANGVVLSNDTSYTATVTVTQQALGAVPATEALRITIQVRYGIGDENQVTLDAYRTRYAPVP
jgi:MSHA pilin protein MshD